MKKLIPFLLCLALVSCSTLPAQSLPKNVQKTPSTNLITEDLVFGPGRTLSTSGGGAIIATTLAAGFTGQTSIVTVGTIGTGVWAATTIAEPHGGTGQTAYTKGDLLVALNSTTLAKLAKGPDTYVLTSNSGATNGIDWEIGGGGGGGTVGSGTANQMAYYASSGTTVNGLATANNGLLVTNSSGVPSITSTLPAIAPASVTSAGKIIVNETSDASYGNVEISPTVGNNAGISFITNAVASGSGKNWLISNNYAAYGNLDLIVSASNNTAPVTPVFSFLPSGQFSSTGGLVTSGYSSTSGTVTAFGVSGGNGFFQSLSSGVPNSLSVDANPLILRGNSYTEWARLSAAGNLLVGLTSDSGLSGSGNIVTSNAVTTPKIIFATGTLDLSGTGNPNGAVSAPVGSTYRRTDGTTSADTFYIKTTGTGNTGWGIAAGLVGGTGSVDTGILTASGSGGNTVQGNGLATIDNSTGTAVFQGQVHGLNFRSDQDVWIGSGVLRTNKYTITPFYGPGAGTSPSSTCTGSSVAGVLSITTGTGCSAGTVVEIDFPDIYTSANQTAIILCARNANAALITFVYPDVTGVTPNAGFKVEVPFAHVLADSTTYIWSYIAVTNQ